MTLDPTKKDEEARLGGRNSVLQKALSRRGYGDDGDDGDDDSEWGESDDYDADANRVPPTPPTRKSTPTRKPEQARSGPSEIPRGPQGLRPPGTLKEALALRRKSTSAESGSDSDTASAFSKLQASAASFDVYAGVEFVNDVDRLQSRFQQDNPSLRWKPPRDSLVLAIRLTHRMYDLVRSIAFKRTKQQKAKGLEFDRDLDKENESLVLPATVRRFCNGKYEKTLSALELAASALKRVCEDN